VDIRLLEPMADVGTCVNDWPAPYQLQFEAGRKNEQLAFS
jgi:hypothetical protein